MSERFYRSARTADVEREFSGQGASLYAGRWNSRGRRVIYLASSRALALLETLVHVETAPIASPRYFFPVDLPESAIETLPTSELPKGWNAADVPEAAREVGDRWLEAGEKVALRVPSAVLPLEPNLLINPLHPEFGALVVHPAEQVALDPRVVRLRPLRPPAPFRPRKPSGA